MIANFRKKSHIFNLEHAEKEIIQTKPVQVIVLILAETPKNTPRNPAKLPTGRDPKGSISIKTDILENAVLSTFF